VGLPPHHPEKLLKKFHQNFDIKIAAVNGTFTTPRFLVLMLKFLPRFFQKAGGGAGAKPSLFFPSDCEKLQISYKTEKNNVLKL
jgi:hypothetical protein